uniref:Uncharacterized protein n=1 Tax=Arundo donax TaxID=35708 RepID=A0A0A9FNB3_ARUDO
MTVPRWGRYGSQLDVI